jgi:hypothetical protein
MSDVAFLAGLSESTFSRLWDDPCWLDRISGKSLQALIGAIPRVGEYVLGYALRDRHARLAKSLTKHGVTVNRDAFKALILDHGVAEQYLSNALSVALPIFEGDADQAAAYLFRFWGRDQDFALSYLIGTSDGPRLLLDPNPLIFAAVRIVDHSRREQIRFTRSSAKRPSLTTWPGSRVARFPWISPPSTARTHCP